MVKEGKGDGRSERKWSEIYKHSLVGEYADLIHSEEIHDRISRLDVKHTLMRVRTTALPIRRVYGGEGESIPVTRNQVYSSSRAGVTACKCARLGEQSRLIRKERANALFSSKDARLEVPCHPYQDVRADIPRVLHPDERVPPTRAEAETAPPPWSISRGPRLWDPRATA